MSNPPVEIIVQTHDQGMRDHGAAEIITIPCSGHVIIAFAPEGKGQTRTTTKAQGMINVEGLASALIKIGAGLALSVASVIVEELCPDVEGAPNGK